MRQPSLPAGPSWRNRRSTVALTWLALVAIVVVQALPFTYGYRHIADDVGFLSAWADGWSSLSYWSTSLAIVQGRLGMLTMVPINALGAYLSDIYFFRLGFVLLHFAVFGLFAAFVGLLTSTRLVRPLLLLLAILQPIGQADDHMPPVAYPLQNTLPFLALLATRCAILLAERGRYFGRAVIWLARIIFLLALFMSEYAFLFGSALLAGEYVAAWARLRQGGTPAVAAALATVCTKRFLYDAASVLLALVAYLSFRWVFPSSYVGNTLDGALNIGRLIETIAGHVVAGTVFAQNLFAVASFPQQAIPLALVVGVLTAACLLVILWDVSSLPSPGLIALVCLVAIVYVTFPLAATAKQQAWCVDSGACGYLDSRISYLGVALIILCAIASILKWLPTHRATETAVVALSIGFGFIAATTYAANVRDGLPLSIQAKVWQRANFLACHPDIQPAGGRRLVDTINPEGLVRFDPRMDQAQFWRTYFLMAAGPWRCASATDRQAVDETNTTLQPGRTVFFNDRAAMRYLDKGWSSPEAHGVWSDGKEASLRFGLSRAASSGALPLRVSFTVYIRPTRSDQTIEVLLNGRPVETWTIARGSSEQNCCERTVSMSGLGEEVELTFRVGHPRVPEADRELVDSRHLGLFLQSLSLSGAN